MIRSSFVMSAAEELTGNIEMSGPITPSSHFQLMKTWISQRRAGVKPWTEFFSSSRLSKPRTVAEVGSRVVKNLEVYQSNYIMIFLLLVGYCVLTSPLLLIALSVAGGGCWFVTYRNEGKKIKLMGREFSVMEQYVLILLLSLPLFFLASAGSTVFWIIGASFFVIALHASLLSSSVASEEITMEEVVVS